MTSYIPSLLYLLLATGFGITGVRGLSGREFFWVMWDSDDPHTSLRPDYFLYVRGKATRYVGAGLIVAAIVLLELAWRAWP
jgi:hypothetical protein